MHHFLGAIVAICASPAFAAPKSGSCESIPAEALLAVFALLFALRPLSNKH